MQYKLDFPRHINIYIEFKPGYLIALLYIIYEHSFYVNNNFKIELHDLV